MSDATGGVERPASPDPSGSPGPTGLDTLVGRTTAGGFAEVWRNVLGAARRELSSHRRAVGGIAVLVAVVTAGVVTFVVVNRPADAGPVELRLPRAATSTATATVDGAGADPSGVGSSGAAAGAAASSVAPKGAALTVYVVGAVQSPGVLVVPPGARVADAVAAAGGASPDADLRRINLAAKVVDSQQIDVPRVGEPATASPSSGATGPCGVSGGATAPIDLNTATPEQLETLPGVGPATATAIVAHRDAHGPFRRVDDLDEVRGIGPARMEQLRPLVSVGS